MSDIEETMSILSRRSRSTTPTQIIKNGFYYNKPDQALSTYGGILEPKTGFSIQDYGSLDRRLGFKGKIIT